MASSTAFDPFNTQSECEARAQEAFKGSRWAMCEAIHLVTDTVARLLPIAVPAKLPENALDAPSLAENTPIYITVPKLPYSIPKGE